MIQCISLSLVGSNSGRRRRLRVQVQAQLRTVKMGLMCQGVRLSRSIVVKGCKARDLMGATRRLWRRKNPGEVFRESSTVSSPFQSMLTDCACRSILRRRSMQMTKSLTYSMGGYLPNTLTEMWEPSRDFAFLRLPTSGARCVVALSGYVSLLASFLLSLILKMVSYIPLTRYTFRTMPHLMVISSEGYFYLYSIDLENGGECSLIKQYR